MCRLNKPGTGLAGPPGSGYPASQRLKRRSPRQTARLRDSPAKGCQRHPQHKHPQKLLLLRADMPQPSSTRRLITTTMAVASWRPRAATTRARGGSPRPRPGEQCHNLNLQGTPLLCRLPAVPVPLPAAQRHHCDGQWHWQRSQGGRAARTAGHICRWPRGSESGGGSGT